LTPNIIAAHPPNLPLPNHVYQVRERFRLMPCSA
jgi:hypothetical protein